MSVLTLVQASQLALPSLQLAYVQDTFKVGEQTLFSLLPFQIEPGLIVRQYTRKNTNGTEGAWVARGHTALTPQFASGSQVTDTIKTFLTSVEIDRRDVLNANILAQQLAAKSQAVRQGFLDGFINADGSQSASVDNFTGLKTLASNFSRTVYAAGSTTGSVLELRHLDFLRSYVPMAVERPGQAAFITSVKGFNEIIAARYDLGGADPKDVNSGGAQFPSHNGIPIVQVDDSIIPQTETAGTDTNCFSIYCVFMDTEQGVSGFGNQNQLIDIAGPILAKGSNSAAFNVALNVGLSGKSTLCVARLAGIKPR